jgi:hypothetical protein
LHPVEGIEIDQRRMSAPMPAIPKRDLADVRAVAQHHVERAPRKRRLRAGVLDTLACQPFRQAIERVTMKGVEFEDAAYHSRLFRLDFHNASAIDAAISIAVAA